MSIPYIYQIKGCSSEFSSEINGYLFTATLKLFDVAGDDDITQAFNALVDNNVPLIGTDLWNDFGIDPDLEGCWLRSLKARPLGDRQWEVVMEYQHSPFNDVTGNISVNVTTQTSEVQSNKDKDGTPIILDYEYPADYGGTSATQEQLDLRGKLAGEQGGTFGKLVPETTRIFELREAQDPGIEFSDIVGTINDAQWILAGDTNKWMLTNVTGTTDNSQQSPQEWVNSYTFQYKTDGWKPEVVYTDKNTNEPVPDPVTDVSKVTVDAYEENDFSTLFPDFNTA